MNYFLRIGIVYCLITIKLFALTASSSITYTPVFDVKFHASSSNVIKEDSKNNLSGRVLNSIQYKSSNIKDPNFSGICTYPYIETGNSGFYFDINNSIFSNDKISIMFWIKLNDRSNNGDVFLDIVNSNNSSLLKLTTDSLDGKGDGLSFYAKEKGALKQYIDNNAAFNKDKWVNVSIVFDGNEGFLYYYLNGLIYKKINIGKGDLLLSQAKKIFIGRDNLGEKGFIGALDEIKIFNNITTPKEILNFYKNEATYKNDDGTERICKVTSCVFKRKESSDPISDVFGKVVFTQNKFTYECTTIKKERGSCRTEDLSENYVLPELNTSKAYINTFAGGRLEEIASIASTESYANSIMSGWKGYCVKGLQSDFSWMSDPYFWGSVTLSFIGGEVAASGATTADQATTAAIKAGEAQGKTITGSMINQAVKEAAKKELYKKMASYAICTAQAGMDLAKMAQAGDKIPCDPVDQICSEKAQSYDDQTYSFSETEYNDMLKKDPEYSKYIRVTSRENGEVYFMIVPPSGATDQSAEEAKKTAEKAKKMMQNIQKIVIGVSAAVCLGKTALSGSTATSTNSGSNDKGFSAADGAKMVAGTAATMLCGPACGAAAQVVGALATSWTPVNSCDSESDATSQGDRHETTFKAKKMNLCKFTFKACEQKDVTGTGCQLTGYHYCCYDSMLTKILAEQVKAQYALGWQHCTGISLNELMHINFSSCRDTTGVDGTVLPFDASYNDRRNAFQAKDKCIDYRKYVGYIERVTGGRFASSKDLEKSLIKNEN